MASASIPVDHGFHHLVGGVVLDHLLVAALLLKPIYFDGGQAVMVHIGNVAPVREELAANFDRLDGAGAVNINNCLLVSNDAKIYVKVLQILFYQ